MKLKIQTYKYERVPVKDDEIFIPDEPFYCFQTGVRRSVKIVPVKVHWDVDPESTYQKGDIFQLNVTCVYLSFKCIVEKFTIDIYRIEELVNARQDGLFGKNKSIVDMLYHEDYYTRTKEQFEEDLNAAINNFQNDGTYN